MKTKNQWILPQEVRAYLHLESGDEVMYELRPDHLVAIRKAPFPDVNHLEILNATLGEWASEEDCRAYKDL